MSSVAGGCFCQKIRYQVHDRAVSKGICYCSQCQKSGAAYGSPLLVLHKDQFECSKIDLGSVSSTSDRGATVTRNFCKDCGTHIFSQISDVPDFITVKAVTMDNFNMFKPDYLVWTESAVDFCAFPDGITKYRQGAPLEILLGVN